MTENSPHQPVAKEAQKTAATNELLAAIFKKKETKSTTQSTVELHPTDTQNKPKKQLPLAVKIGLGLIISLLVIAGIYTAVIGKQLQTQAMSTKETAAQTYTIFKTQNLPAAQEELKKLTSQVDELHQTYRKLSFYNYVPFLNKYYQDGEHAFNGGQAGLAAAEKALTELTPYADVLGFQGEGSFSGGTAEDRIKLLIETLDKVMPSFDAIAEDLRLAKDEIMAINPKRYPEKIGSTLIRENLIAGQTMLENTVTGFLEFRPVLEQLPELAGGKGERKKYLILFQNDNELRPTGGFLTAYAVIYVENGKITPEKSDDIYELDQKFTKKIAIPESLGKYLTTERYWNLRDMNISPDFKTSMDEFFANYQTVRGEPTDIDGIIAIDTQVLTDLLTALGPVQLPGYGNFSAEPDDRCGGCAQVVYALSEIITKPTPYIREDRKGILGPLMQATLQKAYSAPKEKWPELFQYMWQDLEAKHIQLYFVDEQAQQAAETVNAAGRLQPTETDFLAIVNANLAGAKSNLFINYDVKQEITIPTDGRLEKTVEITYRNTRKADNCNLEAGLLCLNSTLKDWTRLYLPSGAELISAQGFTSEPTLYDEAGFTVIDGFFSLEPLGVAKLKLTYTIPYTDQEMYRVTLWKQGGVDNFETLFDVNGGEEKVIVNKDTLVEIPF
ncbi:MAG: DUF4012 domain-containing protein [Patescibacteria group bacterium]